MARHIVILLYLFIPRQPATVGCDVAQLASVSCSLATIGCHRLGRTRIKPVPLLAGWKLVRICLRLRIGTSTQAAAPSFVGRLRDRRIAAHSFSAFYFSHITTIHKLRWYD